MMARMAAAAGFSAAHLGGGAMGFLTCSTEANLGLAEMLRAGVEIRAVTRIPLILDGTCEWGDPVHVRHTTLSAQAAGFQAIEIEDQVLPKRVHHHIEIERIVDQELMTAKIAEAVAARHDPNFLVIARTNAARVTSIDDALRRSEAFHKAGADVLLPMIKTPDDLQTFSQRLPPPLMRMASIAAIKAWGLSTSDLHSMGFRLVVDSGTPFFAMHRALRDSYAAMRDEKVDPLLNGVGEDEERETHLTIGLETMLEIERRTVERGVRTSSEPDA